MSGQSDPKTDSSPQAEAGDDAAGSAGTDSPEAAEAARFGGITWADESETFGDAQIPGDAPSVESSAYPPAPNGVDDETPAAPADGDPAAAEEISVESLVADLERVAAERDQYLDASRRLQAEFENYRKAVAKREVEARERANESLVSEILPVLDACDGALASGAQDVEPVRASLLEALTKQGLARIDEPEAPFDPECHEAVMHEPDENGAGPVVAEVMRAGYSWKGRVVRPAMVRVRG